MQILDVLYRLCRECGFRKRVIVFSQKFEAMKNWVYPSFVTEVRWFLGLASYYHMIFKNFTSIFTHLTRLNQRKVPFVWSDKCEESFQKIKILLTTIQILAFLIKGKNFIVLLVL